MLHFHVLRGKRGNFLGIALITYRVVLTRSLSLSSLAAREPTHLCDGCGVAVPIVFCHGHTEYLCEQCLPLHVEPGECRFSSMEALRMMRAASSKGRASERVC
jgi:hypothetical protein